MVVGLGNPGKKYEQTRHNAGFRLVEQLAAAQHFPPFAFHSKSNAEISKKDDTLLVKPQTYMNRSGEAVRTLVALYKDKLQTDAGELPRVYVIHDDLDLELGNYKVQLGTGPKIHNGLLSLYDQLGTHQFWHVRVGVDTRQGSRTIPADRYVLLPFTEDEEAMFSQVTDAVTKELTQRLFAA